MNTTFSLCGKVALVTGCETGLGFGIAVGLAEAGADIFGVGIGDMGAIQEKVESFGRKFAYITANLMSIESVGDIVSECVKALGRMDILVNNAGIIRRENALDFSEKDWNDVIDINLKTVFFLSQAAAREYMKQGSGGKVINICSMLSFQGGIRVPSYTASKSGVMGITRAMANEWAKFSINVNAVAPGYMITNNTAPIRDDAERTEEITARIPAGRWGVPADLAGAVVFLASEASNYVHGAILPVDGGWLAR